MVLEIDQVKLWERIEGEMGEPLIVLVDWEANCQ